MAQKFLTGVQLTDGSAGSPALSFSSDTNTGIYRSGDDHVNISVGGTNMFKVSSAGITSSVNVYSGTSGQFRNYAGVWKGTTGQSGGDAQFILNGKTIMHIDEADERVGIGNTSPYAKLHITGANSTASAIRQSRTGTVIWDQAIDSSGRLQWGTRASEGGTRTVRFGVDDDGTVDFTGNAKWVDGIRAVFGGGADMQIHHTGSTNFIEVSSGGLNIRQNTDDGDISFQSDDGSGGITEYFRVDGGDERVIFSKGVKTLDSVNFIAGTGNDLKIRHNGTNSFIENNTGNLEITNTADDKDIIFKSDNGSGGVTSYFELDGSAVVTKFRKNLYLLDDVALKIGNSYDLDIKHDGTDSYISNTTGNLYITNGADDKDIIFKSDNGSGGTADYLIIDGSQVSIRMKRITKWDDNIKATFGDGTDLQIYHNGTNSNIENFTGTLQIIQNLDDGDISFRCDDGSGGTTEYFRVDGGEGRIVYLQNGRHLDNVRSMYGTGADLQIFHDGSGSKVENYTGNLTIQQRADDSDIVFQCDNGSGDLTDYFRLDGSATNMKVSKDIRFFTNVDAEFGTGGDFKIYHDGSNQYLDMINSGTGNIVIQNQNDDADIIFKSDNGSGGIATYMSIDGAEEQVRFFKPTEHGDGVLARFGNGGDLRIYHDGTDSYIHDNGTGDLRVRTNRFVLNNAADTENLIRAEQNSSVELFYNGQKKLETTNTGVTITGDLEVTGTTTTVNQTNLDVSDNIIGLNRGASTNTNDSGIIIERGSTGDNAAILWDESNDDFVFGLTTATPSATGNVSLSDYRGIKTGPITASGNLTVSADSDRLVTLGRAKVGSYVSDYAYFSHFDYGSSSNYALNQSPTGNTSINAPTGGQVQLKINNSAKVTLVGDNVGIGTASPSSRLHVAGDIRTDNSIIFTGTGFINNNTTNLELETVTNKDIILKPHGTGNVGIGTTDPQEKLDISAGSIRLDDNQRITWASTDANVGRVRITGNESSDFITFVTDNSEGMRLNNTGLGIGTTSPNEELHIVGTAADLRLQSTGTNTASRYILQTDDQEWRMGTHGGQSDNLWFYNANDGAYRMVISTAGNVGIGTTNPAYKLDVGGTSRIGGTIHMYGAVRNYSGNFSLQQGVQDSDIFFKVNDGGTTTTVMTIDGSESTVGIGTTAPQTNTKLEVSGALKAGNKTSWSDRDGAALTTTGRVVAGLTGNANGNGASALYIFTCYGGNGYQRIVYSCRNQSGTWVVNKDIDEGVDAMDVVASTPSSGSAVTFTFKGRTSSQSYTASVFIEHMGHNLDTQYVG